MDNGVKYGQTGLATLITALLILFDVDSGDLWLGRFYVAFASGFVVWVWGDDVDYAFTLMQKVFLLATLVLLGLAVFVVSTVEAFRFIAVGLAVCLGGFVLFRNESLDEED